jgi:hypothetical protein
MKERARFRLLEVFVQRRLLHRLKKEKDMVLMLLVSSIPSINMSSLRVSRSFNTLWRATLKL